ncbi:pentapeptide repeat-containing protein [Kovacikia minuta CCNUW1]|uniref:pentapeptide repeat-containing protein n=1 Tax=Kovacikia minuta TaxID=2931930 RepID=UPI001CCB36A5|nr:pentapeptide repeat-containing protein [Kovacikia minuta]UBF25892.1 pentapeptide repeat-containing protein [Kovacikia minuta CCNUW1]
MKLRNFALGVLISALASTAVLHTCDSKLTGKSGNSALQTNSSASIAAKSSDNGKPETGNQSGKEFDQGERRSTISPKQPAVDQLLETGACPGCDLKEANLEGLNLEGVNLEGANLEGANLAFTRLENAILKRANLKRANLEGAALGCNIRLSLPRNQGNRGFSFHTYTNTNGSGNSNVDINVNLSRQGTNLDLYAEGDTKECMVLQGADLKEARLPDGSVYP